MPIYTPSGGNRIGAGLEADLPAPVGGVQTIGVTSVFSAIARPQLVRAANPETVNNSAAVQDDDELFLSVVANAIYEVHGIIFYDGGGSGAGGADFRMAWSGPAGATFDWTAEGLIDNTTGGTSSIHKNRLNIGSTAIVGATAAGTNLAATPSGLLVVGGTAGTFRFRWAQGAATVSDTIRQAGSALILHRLA